MLHRDVGAANYIVEHMGNDAAFMNCLAIKRLGLTPVKLTSIVLGIEDAMQGINHVMS